MDKGAPQRKVWRPTPAPKTPPQKNHAQAVCLQIGEFRASSKKTGHGAPTDFPEAGLGGHRRQRADEGHRGIQDRALTVPPAAVLDTWDMGKCGRYIVRAKTYASVFEGTLLLASVREKQEWNE